MTVTGSRGVRHAVLLSLLVGCTFDVQVGKSAVQNALDSDASLLPPDEGVQGGAGGQGGGAGGDGGMRLIDAGAAGTGGTGAGGAAGFGAGGTSLLDAAAVTSATCTPNVAASAQLASFDFNEGKGSVIGNRLGSAGSLSPAPTNWIQGVAGGAVAFKQSAVIVPDHSLLDETGISGVVSLSAWVKVDSISPGAQSIVSRAESDTSFEHFGLAMLDGRPVFKIHIFFIDSAALLPVGRWVNLVGTYDGITATLYVDGKQSTARDIGWPIATDTTPLVMGARQDPVAKLSDYFQGALDEVKVYGKRLTAADVAALSICR